MCFQTQKLPKSVLLGQQTSGRDLRGLGSHIAVLPVAVLLVIAQRQREEHRVWRDKPPVNVLESSTGAIMFPDGHIVRPAAGYDRLCAIQRPRTVYDPKFRAYSLVSRH